MEEQIGIFILLQPTFPDGGVWFCLHILLFVDEKERVIPQVQNSDTWYKFFFFFIGNTTHEGIRPVT